MIWSYEYSVLIWPPIITAAFLLALSVYSFRRRKVPGALPFAVASALISLWVIGSLLEYAALDASTKIFWIKFQTLWQLPVNTAITFFVLEYIWPKRYLNRRNMILSALVPVFFQVMILTNNFHHLVWRGFGLNGSIVQMRGPVFLSVVVYGYVLVLIQIAALVWLFLRSRQHRWPVGFLLIGHIGARTIHGLEIANVLQFDLPLDVLFITFLFLMYGIALFSFRILDPISLASQRVIEHLRSGVLIVDPEDCIVGLNRSAEQILEMPASRAEGQSVRDLLPVFPDRQQTELVNPEYEFSLGKGQGTRFYRLGVTPLNDWRGEEVGRLGIMVDVTEQKRTNARILEQERALAVLKEREHLARELHDNMGQVCAFVNSQGQTIQRLISRGDTDSAQEHIARLVDVVREADVDIRESILGLRITLFEKGFFPALSQYLARYEKSYGIPCRLEVPEIFEDGNFETEVEVQLMRIVQEALTNVRKHAEAQNVRIVFTIEGSWAKITVSDDGQGVNQEVSPDGIVEQVGQRVMRERAAEVGGSVNIQSHPGEGTVVEVRMPLKTEERDHG